MPIQKITIKTPMLIQIFFWIWMIVPLLIITTIYSVIDANASPSIQECKQMYYDSFFQEIKPSPCKWRYAIFTRQLKIEMAQNERYYALLSNQ